MTDEELIARLRAVDVSWSQVGEDCAAAADRIEALRADKERLGREVNMARYGQPDFAWSIHKQAMAELQARAERLEALLREARIDLEHYVTHEYPKHLHPYYERQWNRDMELCRRIDAALTTEAENDRT